MEDENGKALRRVESDPQIDMFGAPVPVEARPRLSEKGFVDPDPTQLVFGALRLEEYLNRTRSIAALTVREVVRSLDLSEFEAAYTMTGRAPYHPSLILGLVIYGILRGHSSLRGLEEMATLDLGAHWVTGGVIPDHSTIGRFIQLHADRITVDFFEQVTRLVLDKTGGASQVWAGDGSVIESAASRLRTIQIDVARELAERDDDDDLSPPDGTWVRRSTQETLTQERLQTAVKAGNERAERCKMYGGNPKTLRVCTTDPEAGVIRTKRGTFAPAWVPSIVTAGRTIIAFAVHPYSEIQILPDLFEQATRVTDCSTAAVAMDANYHSISAAKQAAEYNLLLMTPAPDQRRHPGKLKKSKRFRKHPDFEYLRDDDAYRCPNGKLLTHSSNHNHRRRGTMSKVYRASATDCGACPLHAQCTPADRRMVTRNVDEDLLDGLRATLQQDLVAQLYDSRMGSVEPVFGAIKHDLRLNRFQRRGGRAVTAEFALHAAAHNLNRLIQKRRASRFASLFGLIFAYWAACSRFWKPTT